MVKDLLSAVMYQINRVLFIHTPVSNQIESKNIIHIKTLMIIVQVTLGMKNIMFLVNSRKNGLWKKYFEINQNLLQES